MLWRARFSGGSFLPISGTGQERKDPRMAPRLGSVLSEHGLLTPAQVEEILQRQRETRRPFGLLAESMFNVSREAIEEAWASQYAGRTRTVDPFEEIPRAEAVAKVDPRQAWQFRVLPMSLEGDTLVMATTQRHLCRALRFATSVLDRPAYFVMTTDARLAAALERFFPMPGMSASTVKGDAIRRMVTRMRLDRIREAG